jgi:lysozyme
VTPSLNCLNLIKHCEGERLAAYRDTGGVLTVGVGHTGKDVTPGEAITDEQAMALLQRDMAAAATGVASVAQPCTQSQFDALVSLAFNIGVSAVAGSTLMHFHKAGDHTSAAAEFPKWIHDNGQIISGLIKRRAYEVLLYLGDPVSLPC